MTSRFSIQKPRGPAFPTLSVSVRGIYDVVSDEKFGDRHVLQLSETMATKQIKQIADHFESAPASGNPTTPIHMDKDGKYTFKLTVSKLIKENKPLPSVGDAIEAIVEYHWYTMTKSDGKPGCGVYAELKGF